MVYEVSLDTLLDFLNLANGVFAPLNKFCNYKEFKSIVDNYKLPNGEVFTIPILLPIDDKNILKNGSKIERLKISYKKETIGEVIVDEFFEVKEEEFYKLFGTSDKTHPGLKKQLKHGLNFVGGEVVLFKKSLLEEFNISDPSKTKKVFKERGWKTIVGFQTRNAIHRAHEHLQRIGLEICDGLFINPLVGWKKKGDFTEEAILVAYKTMIEKFYPQNRVYFDTLRIAMRYAGPREAIFHAIIRRNLGCTHFIIGRDHAGVGNFYGKYEAHELAKKISAENSIGVELLLLNEPYFCKKCGQIVTQKNCQHSGDDIIKISGTKIREMLQKRKAPPVEMMRKEVYEALLKVDKIFIEGD